MVEVDARRRDVPSRRRPTARQLALLAELERLFLAEGFIAFTLDDLAARLHCSKSTLYAVAPSKEQLATKVVGRFFRGATEEIERRLVGVEDARTLLATYLAGASELLGAATSEFIRDVGDFEPTRAAYELNSKAAAERIREFIAKGVTDGVFRDVHASLLAEMAGLLVENIQSGVIGRRAGVSDSQAFAALADLLLGGLAPADDPRSAAGMGRVAEPGRGRRGLPSRP
nr:TetR/AcrR family transcriptional regulator [Amycolatopsis antarctica]